MSYATASMKVDAELMREIIKIFMSEVDPVRHLKGLQAALPIQTIAKDEIALHQKNGGNPIGLKEEDGPLFCKSCS